MGVYKLWELLLTIAQPIQIDQLSGKVLAIDASIWIVKLDTLYTANSDKVRSILDKIITLKRNNIQPLFVFDGNPPALKRKTRQARQQKRMVASELQARKQSQIELMRLLEGEENSRRSQKSRKLQRNEREMTEINRSLQNLTKEIQRQEGELTPQILEKIAMQSEILNTKYRIMLETCPSLVGYDFFVVQADYAEMELERKIEYLDELEEYKWKVAQKQMRKERRREDMTQEEKIKKDLQVIEKRTVIREMQDKLYRQIQKQHTKIENGYQIIETIYNGKKNVQRRKIQEKPGQHYGFSTLPKGKMKNDMNSFNFDQKDSKSEEQAQDPFLASFLGNSVSGTTKKSQQSPKEIKQEPRQQFLPIPKKKRREKKEKNNVTSDREQIEPSSNEPESNPIPNQRVHLPLFQAAPDYEPEAFVRQDQLEQPFEGSQQKEVDTDNRDNLPQIEIKNLFNQKSPGPTDNIELQTLFRMIGVPFITAPGQAEAQCAELQRLGIVDGVVTQDSDTFLFGGQHVIRGLFQNNIKWYDYTKMRTKLKLNRQKMIIFALLLGSDYTQGVKGIGIVNAMEIIKVFDTLQKLQDFKKWAEHPDIFLPEGETTEERKKKASEEELRFYELHRKFKNYWHVADSLTSQAVVEAYLQPDTFGKPQIEAMKARGELSQRQCRVELLQKFLREGLELQPAELDRYVRSLSAKFQRKFHGTLDSFLRQGEGQEMARIRSKRLQESIGGPKTEKK